MLAFKLQSCTPDTRSVPSFTRLSHIIYINNVVNKVFIEENRDFVNRIYFSFNYQKTLNFSDFKIFVLYSWHGSIFFQNITVLKQLHEEATYLAKIKAKTSKLSNPWTLQWIRYIVHFFVHHGFWHFGIDQGNENVLYWQFLF